MRTLAILVSATALFAADSKDFAKTVPLEPNGHFSLDTYKGSIRISAWDQPQVEIKAHIVEDPGWHTMPVDSVEIRVDTYSGNVRVKSDYRHKWSWFDEGTMPFVHYTIKVPRGASLQIEDYKSESDISGVQGELQFNSYKGTARIDGLQHGATLKTYKGDIRAQFAKFSSQTHVDTYKGTVELSIPRSSAFEIRARLERHADFDCDFARTLRTSSREREFHSTVNGGGPELKVNSYRGTIRVRST